MNPRTLTTALHVDGLANILAGVALLVAGGWLATPFGLDGGWPLHLAGALLVVYGVDNHLVARRPSRAKLSGLAAVDIGFAAAALVFVLTDPTTAVAWVRWMLVAAAAGSAAFGLVKLAGTGLESLTPHSERRMIRRPSEAADDRDARTAFT